MLNFLIFCLGLFFIYQFVCVKWKDKTYSCKDLILALIKLVKEYAEKIALEKYPDESYWIGDGITSRKYNPNFKQNKAFAEGYMTAIEKTAAPELLDALNLCVKIFEDNGYKGVFSEEKYFIINAIKKATE